MLSQVFATPIGCILTTWLVMAIFAFFVSRS